jgi:hypothetical protein
MGLLFIKSGRINKNKTIYQKVGTNHLSMTITTYMKAKLFSDPREVPTQITHLQYLFFLDFGFKRGANSNHTSTVPFFPISGFKCV